MAGVFRFSNAVSNIEKFIDTYKRLYGHFASTSEAGEYFGHAEAAEFLAMNGLASSLGAIGEEALNRSTRDDKSRDPLYNQHKSYSEMFRMLGWYEPGNMQTNFKLSEYGSYIAETKDMNILRKLFSLNILHIVSPNPLTTVKGYNVLRPFPLILKLMLKLDGIIARDEMILGVLACEDDTIPNVLNDTVKMIKELRSTGRKSSLDEAILRLRQRQNLGSAATLGNYTRFPIAALKWVGWATGENKRGVYGNATIKVLQFTTEGRNMANRIISIPDVRYEFLKKYSEREIAAFVALSNLTKLSFVGFDIGDYSLAIPNLKQLCKQIITDFELDDDEYLFFGYQEAPRDILSVSDTILEELT